MLIGDNYLLMIPEITPGVDDRIVLYAVDSMLALRESANQSLVGHPSIDLEAADAWGEVKFSARKIAGWLSKDRLVKARLNTGGSIRITYAEPREWRRYLSDEDIHWLSMLSESSALYVQAENAAVPETENNPASDPSAKTRKRRIKAKHRRKRDRGRGGNYV